MRRPIKSVAFLGSSHAVKPMIMIQTLVEMDLLGGRGLVLFTESESGQCSDFCRLHDIPVIVFDNSGLDDEQSMCTAQRQGVDVLISAGWPHKVPRGFLGIFPFVSINCHGSVLPDYRGTRAYMHYWANCAEYYGATIHYMNDRLDDGNIIVQGRLKAFMEETPAMVHHRTAELCAYLLPHALYLVELGFEGFPGSGQKRYFKQLSPDEFQEYRRHNLGKVPTERKITPHRVLS